MTIHRFFFSYSSAALAAAWVVALAFVSTRADEPVISHIGSTNPAEEGWALAAASPDNSAFFAPVNDGGIEAWNFTDAGTGSTSAQYALTDDQIILAMAYGWRLSVTLNVVPATPAGGSGAIGFGFQSHVEGSANVYIGLSPGGDPIARIWGSPPLFTASSAGYHQYDLVYDPADDKLHLAVDSVPDRLVAPMGEAFAAQRIWFGSGSSASVGAGNYSHVEFVLNIPFEFNGFLPPIGGADATGGSFNCPVRTFKMGSTIPVKFTASRSSGPVLSGIHKLEAIKYTGATTFGDPVDATPPGAESLGSEFTLSDSQWQFNLSTKNSGMSVGIWKITATLSDGSQHSVWIQLK